MALDPASLGTVTPPAEAYTGITGAAFGVARTGTVVLTYGEGRSRATGLLPDLHVALLTADRILATLHEAIAQVYAGEVPRAMTLVTGASATSDIEKIRVTGAHGPRKVAVVVVG
jgi:L-lactate dehydrogenase complex protein LldG